MLENGDQRGVQRDQGIDRKIKASDGLDQPSDTLV